MPDPVWTAQYAMNRLPSENGFAIVAGTGAGVTYNTGGSPANRNITNNSSVQDAIWMTSQVPSLDPSIGVTIECQISCGVGGGDAGFELTFLNAAVLVNIFEDRDLGSGPVPGFNISIPGTPGTPGTELSVQTPSNANRVLWRYLFRPNRNVELYRNGVLVGGPVLATTIVKPSQRVLFWCEGGGVQVFHALRYFVGGAVAPG